MIFLLILFTYRCNKEENFGWEKRKEDKEEKGRVKSKRDVRVILSSVDALCPTFTGDKHSSVFFIISLSLSLSLSLFFHHFLPIILYINHHLSTFFSLFSLYAPLSLHPLSLPLSLSSFFLPPSVSPCLSLPFSLLPTLYAPLSPSLLCSLSAPLQWSITRQDTSCSWLSVENVHTKLSLPPPSLPPMHPQPPSTDLHTYKEHRFTFPQTGSVRAKGRPHTNYKHLIPLKLSIKGSDWLFFMPCLASAPLWSVNT